MEPKISKLPVNEALNQTRRCQRILLELDFPIDDSRVRLKHNLARLVYTK